MNTHRAKVYAIVAIASVVIAAHCILGLRDLHKFHMKMPSNIIAKEESAKDTAKDMEYTDILFMVMGENKYFEKWYKLTRYVDTRVTLFFASYDSPVFSQDCDDDVYCQTLFIPNTTWTEGRNLLAEEAVYVESKLGKKYKYWGFSDDDCHVICPKNNSEFKGLDCWNQLVNFVLTEMPPRAAVLAVGAPKRIRKKRKPRMYSYSTFDAIFNLMRRESVPILIPYVTMPKNASAWSSQAALFYIMRHCLKNAAVFSGITYTNPAHREYERGLREEEIKAIVHNNYDAYMQIDPLPSLSQHQDTIGPFLSSADLNQHMPELNISKCAPLVDRFAKWEKKALDPVRRNLFYSVRTLPDSAT